MFLMLFLTPDYAASFPSYFAAPHMPPCAGPVGPARRSEAVRGADIGTRQIKPHAVCRRPRSRFLGRLERPYSELLAVLGHADIMLSAYGARAYRSFHCFAFHQMRLDGQPWSGT